MAYACTLRLWILALCFGIRCHAADLGTALTGSGREAVLVVKADEEVLLDTKAEPLYTETECDVALSLEKTEVASLLHFDIENPSDQRKEMPAIQLIGCTFSGGVKLVQPGYVPVTFNGVSEH